MRVRKPVNHPMPEIAAFAADMKTEFREHEIDDLIRRGPAGEPTFFACENGRSVGTAIPERTDT